MPVAGSVDVGFAQDMTVHHQQAVEMAGWERDHTRDPALYQLAYDIESTQTQQIGRMQGWLGLWDAAAFPTGGHMAWMSAALGRVWWIFLGWGAEPDLDGGDVDGAAED
ncbi:MAG: DUF305 domain-containing protein, partial [Pseudonocardiales bacterium]|nr:DUF305 domain-containing protein [Pseudonocardiales bacterium]